MDTEHALNIKGHLLLLSTRVKCLEEELKRVQSEKINVEKSIIEWKNVKSNQENDLNRRLAHIECKYSKENAEINKLIKITEDIVDKKVAEKNALVNALKETNLLDNLDGDVTLINWDDLKQKAISACSNKISDNLYKKAKIISESVRKGRTNIDELLRIRSSIDDVVKGCKIKLKSLEQTNAEAEIKHDLMDQKIEKLKVDNDRLKLLIKQCASTDEPLPEFVSNNVRAKFISFLDSDDPKELKQGLEKLYSRQSRIIKMLRHKEGRMIRDCNMLQVAADQTADYLQYYIRFIQSFDSSMADDMDFYIPNMDFGANLTPSTSN